MKTRYMIKRTLLATAISAALLGAVSTQADSLLNVQPVAVYQTVKNQPLADTLRKVSKRSGITFKVQTDLSKDVVNKTVAAANWNLAVKALLDGYNYTLVSEGKAIKTVIITGHNGNGADAVNAKNDYPVKDLIVIQPKIKDLPKKYQSFPAGSVQAVDIPMAKIMSLADKSATDFDLPMGQFSVTHDSTMTGADGSKTWVGHLTDEGAGYQMILSTGAGGVMGHVITPEGTFSIESNHGSLFIVDTSKLDSVGFEHDLMKAPVMNDDILNIADDVSVTQLQTALDAAKKAADDAQSLVDFYQAQLTAITPVATNTNLLWNAAYSARARAKAAYDEIYAVFHAAYYANGKNVNAIDVTLVANYTAAARAYQAASTAYNYAWNAFYAASIKLKSAQTIVAAKTALAATAKANLALALAAFNALNPAPTVTPVVVVPVTPAPVPPTPVVTKAVIDLMVLYTGTTPDFTKQRITYLVNLSNKAYEDSGINMMLRLVYTEHTDYVGNNANSTALGDLASDRGVFAGTSAKRIKYGADLVFLFRPLYAQTAGSCGTTYVEFAGGTAANKWLGYGTISDGTSKDAATSSYCDVKTFTHEIGHTLGLPHDREYSNTSGAYSYSYAWGIQGSFGTIMSYKTPSVMYFSTPSLADKCAGTPCGFAETDATRSSDQTKSVNLTAPVIASFMSTMLVEPIIN